MKLSITLKQWFIEEAERRGITVWGVHRRYYRRRLYPHLKLKRVNARVVFVIQ